MSGAKLNLVNSNDKGRSIFSATDFHLGSLIINEKCRSACLKSTKITLNCSRCFCILKNKVSCVSCEIINYCSKKCLKEDEKMHELECQELIRFYSSTSGQYPVDLVRLTYSILVLAKNTDYKLDMCQIEFESLGIDKRNNLIQLSLMLYVFSNGQFRKSQCLDMITRISCNVFHVYDNDLEEIGLGYFPIVSLINHDCKPNAILVLDNDVVNVIATENIGPDDEITISYLDLLKTTNERKKYLKENYGFHCRCSRCNILDQSMVFPLDNYFCFKCSKEVLDDCNHCGTSYSINHPLIAKMYVSMNKLTKFVNNNSPIDICYLNEWLDTINQMNKNEYFNRNIHLIDFNIKIFNYMIELNEYNKSVVEIGMFLLNIYQKVYSKLSIEYAMLCKDIGLYLFKHEGYSNKFLEESFKIFKLLRFNNENTSLLVLNKIL